MRRQYHSCHTDQGRLFWDVHRLVELSRDLPVIDVPLAEIRELDEPFWFGGNGDVPTCRQIALHAKLMQETDLKHPIILSADRRVMDGMHRVCKALNLGHETIKAVRFVTMPDPDHIDADLDALSYDEPW